MRLSLAIIFCTTVFFGNAQTYTSYFTGSIVDAEVQPMGGVCLMGGASENNEAMKWFLERANGGDVLVLRASGSDGYNDYFFSDLGVSLNSVETIVCHSADCSDETYIQERIASAEAIWFAGGDQWNYISFWRNTKIDSLINDGLATRNIVIGGTSAGMAIQGGYYFSAENGTVTSSAALMNPYNSNVTVDSITFLKNEWLNNVVTDTHFDNPNRKGRLSVFLARILADYDTYAKAIACDEYTAVCIDENGFARVFGDYPDEEDNAYFIQVNCESMPNEPQVLAQSIPLTWGGSDAIKVYRISGTSSGSNGFDLSDWTSGTGGEWLHWSIDEGVFTEEIGSPINCHDFAELTENEMNGVTIFPNPGKQFSVLSTEQLKSIEIYNYSGKRLILEDRELDRIFLKEHTYANGLYIVVVSTMNNENIAFKWIKL